MDGWWSILYQYTEILGSRPLGPLESDNHYVFNSSRNALEDALGLSRGIALGAYLGAINPDSIDGDIDIYGETTISGIRMGSGKWWAIFYLLPSLFSISVLIVLLSQSKKFED